MLHDPDFSDWFCRVSLYIQRLCACVLQRALLSKFSLPIARMRAIGGISPRDSGDRVERPLIYTEQSKHTRRKTSVNVCARRSEDSPFRRLSDGANLLALYTFGRALLTRQGVLSL